MSWLPGWRNRLKLKIDSTKVDSDLNNFPILITLSSGSGITSTDTTDVFTNLVYSSVNYDFTGTDGDAPNSDLWIETDDSNKMQIVSNALEIDSQESTDTEAYVDSIYRLVGDFDIQVDFEATNYNTPTGGGHSSWITVWNESETSYWRTIWRSYNTGDLEYYQSDTSGAVGYTTTDTSGKLRLVRIGSNITSYVWNEGSSQWEFDGDTNGETSSETTSEDLFVRLYHKQEGSGTERYRANFDNFTVNSGTVSWPTGTFPNRKKIAVTDSGGTTQLYVEIEKWDQSNQQAWLWAKVPTVYSGIDTTLYLYYDSSHANNDAYVGDTGDTSAQNVWNSGFEGVWHMGGSSAANVLDSTSSDNDVSSDVGSPAYEQTSQIADGITLDGNDALVVGSFAHSNTITVQALVKLDTLPSVASASGRLVSKDDGTDRSFVLQVHSANDKPVFYVWQSNAASYIFASDAIGTGSAYLLTGVNDGTDLHVYENATNKGTNAGGGGTFDSDAADLEFGRKGDGTNYLEGILSEIRISSAARSSAWIKSDYHSCFDTLITYEPFKGYFTGYVYEENTSNPVSRSVRIYERETGGLLNSTTSSGNGYYYVETTYSGAHYIIALDDNSGVQYNLAALDQMIPITI